MLHDIFRNWLSAGQFSLLNLCLKSEEKDWFADRMSEIRNIIKTIPKTLEQDGMGDNAIVYLHYFIGCSDWYITEKDAGNIDDAPEVRGQQLQAFGLCDPCRDGGELGYVSIKELIDSGVELDLHWTPKTLGEVKSIRKRELIFC